MATSEPRLAVKQSLTPSELDDVGALVREARWNQLAADWRIFIEFGRLYAIHSDAGRIIATTATLPYGGRFAWISMVLVAGEYRRRGLATALPARFLGAHSPGSMARCSSISPMRKKPCGSFSGPAALPRCGRSRVCCTAARRLTTMASARSR